MRFLIPHHRCVLQSIPIPSSSLPPTLEPPPGLCKTTQRPWMLTFVMLRNPSSHRRSSVSPSCVFHPSSINHTLLSVGLVFGMHRVKDTYLKGKKFMWNGSKCWIRTRWRMCMMAFAATSFRSAQATEATRDGQVDPCHRPCTRPRAAASQASGTSVASA